MKGTYIGGIVFAICFITASAIVMNIPVRAQSENLAVFSESASEDDRNPTEEAELPKTGQICEDSGMPCINPEQFERWMETYEQETGEEEAEKPDINTDCREDVQTGIPTELPTEVETTVEVPSERVEETVAVYSVNGETLNPDIQSYLYQRLADHGIEWFMPYAVMVAYQESHFDYMAVNQSNGIDCGLFQFRAPYYEGQDIFNPYDQIDIFTEQMANRANAGLDVYEMISRHNVSDYGTYNNEYVMQVMKHEANLREVTQ